MNIAASLIQELLREKWTEVIVERNPPGAGESVWVRESPRARPAARAQVVDSWAVKGGGYAVVLELVEPDFQLPKETRESGPSLTAEQRRRLFEGQSAPLIFDSKPPLDEGDSYVLSWSRERRIFDGEKVVLIPREALFWIEVTKVVRRPDACSWELRYHTVDRRQPVRLMRRVPVLGVPEPEITSDPKAAIDRAERDGPTNWDGTNLLHLEEARRQHQHLHEDRDREQETRSLTYRLRAARARARARGIDDSREVDAISEWIASLEDRVNAA